ncbi:MAG: NAD(P)-dependent oxidoreductase [Glaciihabitans sp.]|nr:NAD(P)-dependent oxidoreductase [Glaciihabitans sp.]
MTGKKVIVTGGAGRLGRSVVSALCGAGWEVVSIDRSMASGLEARQVVLDLTDEERTREVFAAEAPDAVVHLAAIAVPFSAPEGVILRTNTAISISVLQAAAAAGVPRVLAASSPTVIGYGNPHGWGPQYLPIDENHPVAPWNAYALSKLMIEESVRMFARSSPGVWGIFRPCFVISPEEWDGAPTQQGHTVAERIAEPALAAVSLFNYLDARDAGDFVAGWLGHPDGTALNGEVFFVGADDPLCEGDVREALRGVVPTDAAARLGARQAVFSPAKAKRILGWEPQHSWRNELATVTSLPEPALPIHEMRTP